MKSRFELGDLRFEATDSLQEITVPDVSGRDGFVGRFGCGRFRL
ncbi:MAG: hypothetical protein ACLFNC_05515 [Halodesulfurarchaeum sp.]